MGKCLPPISCAPTQVDRPLALYVHWPWCKKKCPYCDFNSHVNTNIPEEAYIDNILQQLKYFHNFVGERTLTSLFFGGGTPSLMTPGSVEKVISAARHHFTFSHDIEITLEANPTSSSEKKLENFIQAGINRLSIGLQGVDDKNLAFLGREHTASEAIQTVENALKVCKNVNLDLIYGLPNQNLEDWEEQLAWATGIGTPHISAYQLTIEQNTAFYSLLQKGRLTMPSQDIQADFYEATTALLEKQGYIHYEISNYAKQNHICKHNQHIWDYREYIGVGAGAHGRVKDASGQLHATQGKKMPAAFMEAFHNTGTAEASLSVDETLLPSHKAVENIIMSLRTLTGIDKETFAQNCGFNLDTALDQTEKQRFVQLGILHETDSHLVLNKQYWLMLDDICKNIIK